MYINITSKHSLDKLKKHRIPIIVQHTQLSKSHNLLQWIHWHIPRNNSNNRSYPHHNSKRMNSHYFNSSSNSRNTLAIAISITIASLKRTLDYITQSFLLWSSFLRTTSTDMVVQTVQGHRQKISGSVRDIRIYPHHRTSWAH